MHDLVRGKRVLRLTRVAASMGLVPSPSSKNASSQLTAITTGAYLRNTPYIFSLAAV